VRECGRGSPPAPTLRDTVSGLSPQRERDIAFQPSRLSLQRQCLLDEVRQRKRGMVRFDVVNLVPRAAIAACPGAGPAAAVFCRTEATTSRRVDRLRKVQQAGLGEPARA